MKRKSKTCFKNGARVCGAAIALLFAAMALFGCAGDRPGPPARSFPAPALQGEIQTLIRAAREKNAGLRSFKGLGKIRFSQDGHIQSARAAWIGAVPGKFHLAILGPSGTPEANIAGDGVFLYLALRRDNKLYKRKMGDGFVKSRLPVPADFRDMVLLLAGRIPVLDHGRAALSETPGDPGRRLTLWGKKDGRVERIYFDGEKNQVRKVEMYEKTGALQYRAEWGKMRRAAGFEVPFELRVSDGLGGYFFMAAERYWPNVATRPENFVLKRAPAPQSPPQKKQPAPKQPPAAGAR